MRARAELLVYVLVALAFLPLALLEGRSLVYFVLNSGMLEVRDAAIETPAAVMAIYALYLLLPACAVAVYTIFAASRDAKIHTGVLVVALCAWMVLIYLAARFPFNSGGRLYLEAVPSVLLFMLTVALLGIRVRSLRKAPDSAMGGDTSKAVLYWTLVLLTFAVTVVVTFLPVMFGLSEILPHRSSDLPDAMLFWSTVAVSVLIGGAAARLVHRRLQRRASIPGASA